MGTDHPVNPLPPHHKREPSGNGPAKYAPEIVLHQKPNAFKPGVRQLQRTPPKQREVSGVAGSGERANNGDGFEHEEGHPVFGGHQANHQQSSDQKVIGI